MVPRLYLGELLWLAALAVGGAQACRGARSPDADELADLRTALDAAELVAPYARAACSGLPDPEQRRLCHGALDATDEAALVASQVLASAEACREQADAACLEQARESARVLLPRLRRQAPAASSSGGGS